VSVIDFSGREQRQARPVKDRVKLSLKELQAVGQLWGAGGFRERQIARTVSARQRSDALRREKLFRVRHHHRLHWNSLILLT